MSTRYKTKAAEAAIHKTGHACVAVYLKRRFRTADIIEDEKNGSWGCLIYGGYEPDCRWRERRENHCVILFAGMIAQRRFAPRSNWLIGFGDVGGKRLLIASDFDKIEKNLEALDDFDGTKYKRKFEARAVKLVRKLWIKIQRVAKALLKRKVLTQNEVRALMETKRPKRNTPQRRTLRWFICSRSRQPRMRNWLTLRRDDVLDVVRDELRAAGVPDYEISKIKRGGNYYLQVEFYGVSVLVAASSTQKSIRDARATMRRKLRTTKR
jgi:hypothetical protein